MKKHLLFLLLFSTSCLIHGQINLATDGSKASASAAHVSGPAAYAFDANTATGWLVSTSPVQWIQYDFELPVVIDGYAMYYLSDSLAAYQPTSWKFLGSNNGTDWTDIDTISDEPVSIFWEQFVTTNTIAYRYYRLDITEAGNDTLAIGELQLYSITLPTVITGEVSYIEAELAACSGQVTKSGGTSVTQRGICYNTSGNPTLSDSYRFSSAGVGSYNVILPNLTPNTTYYFRAFATNAVGTEYAAEVKTFTTLKLTQTITFPALPAKVYGDPDFDAGASSSSGLTVLLISSNTNVATINGNQLQIVGAGSSVITASQSGNSTYYAAAPVNRTLTVAKKALTATADNKEKSYGDVNPVLSISYAGFINSEDSSVLDTKPVSSTIANENSNAGTYYITLANGSDNNYSFTYVPGLLTVNKAALSATADDKNKIYGEANLEFTISYAGFVNDDNLSDIDVLPVASTSTNETSDAGFYSITLSGGGDNNYTLEYVNGILTIQKAQLIATAQDQVKEYGDVNPELTIAYSGFVNDDSASDLDLVPTASTEATDTSGTGIYAITISGGSDNNYHFSFAEGALTIEKAVLTVTAADAMRYTGEPNPEFEILYSGYRNDDSADNIDVLPTASCLADEASPAGTYIIDVSGGIDNNYSLEYTNGILTVLEVVNSISNTASSTVMIYPNPSNDRLFIDNLSSGKVRVLILTIDGRVTFQDILSENSLDVSGIPAGIYLLRIYTETELLHQQKIMIKYL